MKNGYQFFCLFLCIALSTIGLAKSNKEHVVLAVGKSFSYPFDQTVKWRLKELAGGKILRNGFGPIRKLAFEIPGAYQVDVEEELNYDPAIFTSLEAKRGARVTSCSILSISITKSRHTACLRT